jgi:hypothetical protein
MARFGGVCRKRRLSLWTSDSLPIRNGLDSTRKLLEDLKLRPAVVNLPVDFRRFPE